MLIKVSCYDQDSERGDVLTDIQYETLLNTDDVSRAYISQVDDYGTEALAVHMRGGAEVYVADLDLAGFFQLARGAK